MGGFETIQLDVNSGSSVNTCVSDLIRRDGRIEFLVSNAGSGLLGAIEEITIKQACEFFDANFFGTVRLVKAVLPWMRKQGGR